MNYFDACTDKSLRIKFELRDSNREQCNSWKFEFDECKSNIKISCQYFFDDMTHDAIVSALIKERQTSLQI